MLSLSLLPSDDQDGYIYAILYTKHAVAAVLLREKGN